MSNPRGPRRIPRYRQDLIAQWVQVCKALGLIPQHGKINELKELCTEDLFVNINKLTLRHMQKSRNTPNS